MSLQWALPMLKDLLPDDLWEKVQNAAVDPFYVCPKEGTSMPVYNAGTGEKIKVSLTRSRDLAKEESAADVWVGCSLGQLHQSIEE